MDHTQHKALVLAAAKARLQVIETELRERITDLKAVTIGDENAESASQTESHRGSDIELMNSLGEQVDSLQRDMLLIDGIPNIAESDHVQFGSVVHTNERDLLVVTGIEEFKVGGRAYLGISPRAPLFQALQGKAKGDTITFNGITYTITEVF